MKTPQHEEEEEEEEGEDENRKTIVKKKTPHPTIAVLFGVVVLGFRSFVFLFPLFFLAPLFPERQSILFEPPPPQRGLI